MNKTLSAILVGCLLSNPLYAAASAPLTGFISIGESVLYGDTFNSRETSVTAGFNYAVTESVSIGFLGADYDDDYLIPSISYKLPLPLDTSIKASWWSIPEYTNTSYLELTGKVAFAVEKAKMDVTLDYAPDFNSSKKYLLVPSLHVSYPLMGMFTFVGSAGYVDYENATLTSYTYGTAGLEASYKAFTAGGRYIFNEVKKPVIVWSVAAKL